MSSGRASARLPESQQTTATAGRNPRRTQPLQSKSLPRHIKQNLTLPTEATGLPKVQDLPIPGQFRPQDSHDSNGSDESAGKWFVKANKHGPQGQEEVRFKDGEPPFFLDHQKTYFPNNFVSSGSDDELFGAEILDDSENQDLRGVIDDLTVENKRLKLLLKSSRSRSSPSSTQAQDKLFDLRVHGLSANKKRELESLLRNFAVGVHAGAPSASPSSAAHYSVTAKDEVGRSFNVGPLHQHSKSQTKPTDSGYASNSNSGLALGHMTSEYNLGPPPSKRAKNKHVKDYLHDIPDALLPRQSPYLSERAKMALVVRRLENLFTGRIASPGEHSQPNQQQEVSRLAANAEDHLDRYRRLEGNRESQMLPHDTKVNLDAYDSRNPSPPSLSRTGTTDAPNTGDGVGNISSKKNISEQRPTRPLDLDIHRAQVAAENIQYLRHLGLSSPYVREKNEPKASPWIYLNLLISMAQLHTINVTPSFIRKALKKLSTNFEVSPDGHKVRWAGGTEGTIFSREDERAMLSVDPSPAQFSEDASGKSSSRSKTNSSSNAVGSEEPSSEDKTSYLLSSAGSRPKVSTGATSNMRTDQTQQTKTGSNFEYKPIVYKGRRYSPAASYLESSESPYSDLNDSSGLVHALNRPDLERHGADEGLITFYQNPFFCSDASADHAPINCKPPRRGLPRDTIGLGRAYEGESTLRHHDACYFTPQFAPQPYSSESDEPEVEFEFDLDSLSSAGEEETVPMEFQASGIGGVVPEDNFALDVKVVRDFIRPAQIQQPVAVPFTGTRKRKRFQFEVGQCKTVELQPSRLPPPSYDIYTSHSSSNDVGTNEDSDSETSSEADVGNPTAGFLDQQSTETSEELSDDDACSVDIMRLARMANPAQVAAQERDFLINQDIDRRVEGSLAVTIGDSHSVSSRPAEEVESNDGSVGSPDDEMEVDESSDGDSESDNDSDEA